MEAYTLAFAPRFADLVLVGRKTQTIRSLHRNPPAVGDRLVLCRSLLTGDAPMDLGQDQVVTSVQPIRIFRTDHNWTGVVLDGEYLILIHIRKLALAYGFTSTMDFLRYFERKGLPFEGVLIKWAAQEVAEIPRPENPHTPPPVRECGTCEHEGKSLEDWPCRTSMNAVGLSCWEPKEAHNGAART